MPKISDIPEMIVIDGKKIAQGIIDELRQKPIPKKRLVAVWVGADKASESFLHQKEKTAAALGVSFQLYQFAETDTHDEVEERIRSLCHDETVGGIVVQLPLPKRFNRDVILGALDPKKDVDNLTGRADVESPAVGVVKEILKDSRFQISDSQIAIVGRGFLVGQPIIRWLESEKIKNQKSKIKIKVADVETENVEEFCKDADVVITGVGKAGLINPAWLKDGAGVIDFGFPPDFDSSSCDDPKIEQYSGHRKSQNCKKLAFYTPTPGGTGPILVAKLFENFYALCG